LITGIASGRFFPGHPVIPAAAAVFCLAVSCWAIRKKNGATLVPLILFASLGYLLAQTAESRTKPVDTPGHIVFYAGKGETTLTGRIETVPEKEKRDSTFILSSLRIIGEDGKEKPVKGKLKVRSDDKNGTFDKNDRISVTGRIKEFHNFSNPGGFDYKRFMEKDGIFGNLSGKKGQVGLIEKGKPSLLDRIRSSISVLVDRTPSSASGKAVLKAILTGDRTGVSKDLREDFARTGTSHLLAISGLHVGIVAGFSFMVLRFFLGFVPPLLWSGNVKAAAGFLTLIPVWGYGFLADMSPSTQRAVIMATVFLLTYVFLAEHDILNTLAVAAFSILAVSADSLFDISFQLSFGSVLFIVLGLSAWNLSKMDADEPAWNRPGKIRRSVLSYILITVFAFIGTWPLVAHYFNQVSLIGFIANAAVIPLLGTFSVTLGLSAVFLMPLGIQPSLLIMDAAGGCADLSLFLVRFFSSVPMASFKTVTPTPFEMGSYYVFLLGAVKVLNDRKEGRKTGLPVKAAMTAAAIVLVFDTGYWINRRFLNSDLRVTCLDVGQGTSSLVEFPGGRCMLIDGGGFSDNEVFDVGEKLVAPFLWSKKIARVETVVLSHPESDHLNGLLFILSHFHVDELWTNGSEADTLGFRRLRDLALENRVTVRERKDLTDHLNINDSDIRIFWPMKDRESNGYETARKSNNLSLVLKITHDGQSFLFPGDISTNAEKEILDSLTDPVELKSRVMIVPHHGSKSSSSDEFIDAVSPECAVFSVGYKNWFRFPHPAVLERYESRNIAVLRTDLDGAVEMVADNGSLRIETFVNGDDSVDGNPTGETGGTP
jgi:competence protein ComEC